MWARKFLTECAGLEKLKRFLKGFMDTEFVPQESEPSPVAIIYRSEFDYISRCILDYRNIETGGQLFGFWTSTGIPVILYAIGPGRAANHEIAFFNQDISYLLKVGNHVLEKYGLQHIGEWHSHHQLGLARPSGHDDSTMVNSIRKSHLRRFLLCIGNCDATCSTLNAFNFHEDHGYDYVQAGWIVKECESPFRPLVDSDLAGMLVHPATREACHGDIFGAESVKVCRTVRDFENGYWLNRGENKKILVEINKLLKAGQNVKNVAVSLDERHHVRITVDRSACAGNAYENACGVRETLLFPEGFPQKPVKIEVNGKPVGDETRWNFCGDIVETFREYYAATVQPFTDKG